MRHCSSLALTLALSAVPLIAQRGLPQQKSPTPGTVKLRVLDCNGGPVASCKVSVMRYFQAKGSFGKLPSLPTSELGQRDFAGDVATIRSLPLGEFVVQVEADLHALTRSEPFSITDEANTAEVTVKLQRGTTITGTVYGADGKPLAGATVATREASQFSGLVQMFGDLLPITTTRTSVVTDKEGHYQLKHIASGTYRIVTTHGDYCTASTSTEVKDEKTLALGDVKLIQGAEVFGTCLLGDKPVAGLKVTITKPDSNAAPGTQPTWKTTTDEQGQWRMEEHIPPGDYEICAAQANATNNPFDTLLQMKDSQQTLTIRAEHTKVEKALVIPKK